MSDRPRHQRTQSTHCGNGRREHQPRPNSNSLGAGYNHHEIISPSPHRQNPLVGPPQFLQEQQLPYRPDQHAYSRYTQAEQLLAQAPAFHDHAPTTGYPPPAYENTPSRRGPDPPIQPGIMSNPPTRPQGYRRFNEPLVFTDNHITVEGVPITEALNVEYPPNTKFPIQVILFRSPTAADTPDSQTSPLTPSTTPNPATTTSHAGEFLNIFTTPNLSYQSVTDSIRIQLAFPCVSHGPGWESNWTAEEHLANTEKIVEIMVLWGLADGMEWNGEINLEDLGMYRKTIVHAGNFANVWALVDRRGGRDILGIRVRGRRG